MVVVNHTAARAVALNGSTVENCIQSAAGRLPMAALIVIDAILVDSVGSIDHTGHSTFRVSTFYQHLYITCDRLGHAFWDPLSSGSGYWVRTSHTDPIPPVPAIETNGEHSPRI